MENLWNDVIPYWNEEFIEADETAARKRHILQIQKVLLLFFRVVAM